MSKMTKLDFRLVPTKGVTTGGGFRGEFVRGYDKPLDIETVIAEAQAKGAFSGLSPSRVHCDLETFFDTMIGNVLADGKTRKATKPLKMKIMGMMRFEAESDQFLHPRARICWLSQKSVIRVYVYFQYINLIYFYLLTAYKHCNYDSSGNDQEGHCRVPAVSVVGRAAGAGVCL